MAGLILFGISLLLMVTAITVLVVTRKRMVEFTQAMSDNLDGLLSGENKLVFEEEKDTLTGKVQMKTKRLYELMEERAASSQADRMLLEANIGDLSHQVKTPIANIRMYHSFLQKAEVKETDRKEFLSAMGQQVDKLEFLIQSMIKMSRLETGIVKVKPTESKLYQLLEEAVCDVALKAEEKDIDIHVSCKEDIKAFFDYKWTLEAVYNILDNAVKYTEEKGTIQIRAKVTDFFVRIQIEDNGKGISEEHLTEIFKRFYREPEVHQSEGVGIGLYLAREIITKQKGFVEVSSKVGEGSVFSVHLPLEQE